MRAQAAVWKTQPAPSVTEATRAGSVTEPWTRVADGVEVGALAGREVVEDDYLMAELDEAVDEVGAYEAAAACDDVFHGRGQEPKGRAGSLGLLAVALLCVLVPML